MLKWNREASAVARTSWNASITLQRAWSVLTAPLLMHPPTHLAKHPMLAQVTATLPFTWETWKELQTPGFTPGSQGATFPCLFQFLGPIVFLGTFCPPWTIANSCFCHHLSYSCDSNSSCFLLIRTQQSLAHGPPSPSSRAATGFRRSHLYPDPFRKVENPQKHLGLDWFHQANPH